MMSHTVQEHQSTLVLDHSQVGMWHLVPRPLYVLVELGTGFPCTGVSSNFKRMASGPIGFCVVTTMGR
jgi:hypothetical protein